MLVDIKGLFGSCYTDRLTLFQSDSLGSGDTVFEVADDWHHLIVMQHIHTS